jgi:hypothetical protein
MKPLFISLLSLLPLLSFGQHQLRAAYFGETITHYGVKIAYDKPFKEWGKTKESDARIKKEFLYGGSFTAFRHPHQLVGLIVSPEITWRRTGKRGGLFDVAIAPAYFRYFYEGKTYEYTGTDFHKIPLAGRSAFLPTLSVGGGRDLSVNQGIPFMWYYRLNVMRQYPYHASSLMRFAIEAGVIKKF